MANALFITRTEMPRREHDSDPMAAQAELGGQWDWCWAMPFPYRVLAAPRAGLPMPSNPASAGPLDDFFPYLSYWATLRSFLSFSFGWTRHDKGLAWWYEAGCPTDDPRLALLHAVWERDGMLERYLTWCIDRWPHAQIGHEDLGDALDSGPAKLKPATQERVRHGRGISETTAATPFGKHLEFEFHVGGAAMGDAGGDLTVVTDAVSPRAVLTAESAIGWYRTLARLGATLPPSAKHAWRVDVFVRPIGFVGTYRRSWKTGLWFSGQHRYHAVGN